MERSQAATTGSPLLEYAAQPNVWRAIGVAAIGVAAIGVAAINVAAINVAAIGAVGIRGTAHRPSLAPTARGRKQQARAAAIRPTR